MIKCRFNDDEDDLTIQWIKSKYDTSSNGIFKILKSKYNFFFQDNIKLHHLNIKIVYQQVQKVIKPTIITQKITSLVKILNHFQIKHSGIYITYDKKNNIDLYWHHFTTANLYINLIPYWLNKYDYKKIFKLNRCNLPSIPHFVKCK